ncbi:MAG: DUF6249 domain-containing protein [Burkholderiales bacterium]
MSAFAAFLVRHRSWVLVAAALIGLVAAGGLAPSGPQGASSPVKAVRLALPGIPEAAAAPAVEVRIAANEGGAVKTPAPPSVPAPPAAVEPPEAPATPAPPSEARRKGHATVGIEVDDDTGKVRIGAGGGAREFDSFEAVAREAPWIAGLVYLATALVFLTPLLIIVLVIWYKVRKARMLNETMIRLAEKGVIPPADALGAVAGGSASALQSGPPTGPLYEQAKAVRKRAAWSDLRKGIVMGAIGLGLVFYSMLDDGSPNGLGLVLLFVGLGYIVLWYFEERQADRTGLPPSPPPA